MASSKEKSFRKIKRSYTWVSIVFFVIAFIILTVAVNAALLFFAFYSINSKVDNQYERVKTMAGLYDEGKSSDNQGLIDVLHADSPDYVVLSESGDVIDSFGDNTMSNVGGSLGFLFGSRDVRVYEDTKDRTIRFFSGGMLIPDIGLLQMALGTNDPDFYEEENLERIGATDVANMPIWIETKLNGGDRFIAKGNIQIRLVDAIILQIVAFALNLFLLFFLIFRLVRIIREIIRKRRMNELFLVDEVTKGNNWMAFLLKGERILKKSKNAGKRYAMVHLVIVKYRNYCMCHSLDEGRFLLRRISDLIEQSITKEELSAHVSSSSFVLLLEATDAESVKMRLEALVEKLKTLDIRGNAQLQAGHKDTFHTFCFQLGVYLINPSVVDGKKKKRMDAAIEQYYNNAVTAKSTLEVTDDDGIAFFDDKLMEDERWIQTVGDHQQKALDNKEFVVYYQPKYSPDRGELIGAEALVRWQSPDFGFVPPGRFIPIFEKNGFITNIDHYMICHVAEDQKKWLEAGMNPVPVSVNVSRAHFAESDLAEQIQNMVDEIGTPHELIEIELTESAFFDDKNAIIRIIEQLKSFGFSVSMDDFGSGYSSLNSLKDMNLDVLKLDAEFFRGDADPYRKEAVVSEAIRLAKRLHMRTVAEGVEVREEVEFLKQQGCDMIQGYYFAKPMPGEEYEERMKEKYHMPEE